MALARAIIAEAHKCHLFVPQDDDSALALALATQVASEGDRILRSPAFSAKQVFAESVERLIQAFQEEGREVPDPLAAHLAHLLEMCRN